MKKRYAYIAVFSYADDGISITFPDLPGCFSCAHSNEEAIEKAKEALGLHMWGLEQDGEDIPKSSRLQDIKLAEGEIPQIIEVFMPPIRERINNRFVKKTLSLPAWLADMADKDGVNCSKVFQNALMEYLDVTQPQHKH
jgi:predicted RNase H-like HicB family nuclease